MMKSKLSLRSLAKTGLKILPLILFLSSCSYSTAPSFQKEDIPQAVKDICKKEYGLDISTNLVGSTLWVYMPLEDILSKPPKPEKYTSRFSLEDDKAFFEERNLKVYYLIKPIPEKENQEEKTLDKSVIKKILNVLQVIPRVLFSMDNSKGNNPMFFCIVVADIKYGPEIKLTIYSLDLKKSLYGLISQTEYQHRIVQDGGISLQSIGDKEGKHLVYRDITLGEFIAGQIQNRISLKFEKLDVGKNADIDKEVSKIVFYTLNTYGFKDFTFVEMNNLVTGAKNILNQKAVLTDSKESTR